MTRMSFDSLFIEHPDGSIEPRRRIRVGGVDFGPGVRFSKGAVFAGIDFTLFRKHDFDVEEQQGVAIIKAIYQ